MKNIVTLSGIISITLLVSACSPLQQSSGSQRSKAYAYRTPKPQAQQYVPQRNTQTKPVTRKVVSRPASKPNVTPRPSNSPEVVRQKAPPTPIASQQAPQQSSLPQIHPARNHMIGLLRNTIGTPYKWGGNNPQQGFDCSGLMTYVHQNALGIKIPRTAATQRDNSRTLNYANIQPGDMLFFKTSARSNHVGMYIGDRKFIHAPAGGKRVTVASMDNAYWHKRFVKFGTYLN